MCCSDQSWFPYSKIATLLLWFKFPHSLGLDIEATWYHSPQHKELRTVGVSDDTTHGENHKYLGHKRIAVIKSLT